MPIGFSHGDGASKKFKIAHSADNIIQKLSARSRANTVECANPYMHVYRISCHLVRLRSRYMLNNTPASRSFQSYRQQNIAAVVEQKTCSVSHYKWLKMFAVVFDDFTWVLSDCGKSLRVIKTIASITNSFFSQGCNRNMLKCFRKICSIFKITIRFKRSSSSRCPLSFWSKRIRLLFEKRSIILRGHLADNAKHRPISTGISAKSVPVACAAVVSIEALHFYASDWSFCADAVVQCQEAAARSNTLLFQEKFVAKVKRDV